MTSSIRTIDLDHEQLLAFEGRPGERVRVLSGATWLTQEGEAGDAVMRSGDELHLRAGRTLVEALEPTRVQILGVGQPSGRLRRLVHDLQRWVARLQWGPVQPEPLL